MSDWRDLVAEWEQDPAFVDAYQRTFPYGAAADTLLRHRARLGLTQAAYAARLKVRRSAVEKWESGTYPVPARAFA